MNYSEVELLSRAHQLFAGDSRRPGLDAGTTPYGDLLSRAADLNVGAGQRRYQLAVDHSRAPCCLLREPMPRPGPSSPALNGIGHAPGGRPEPFSTRLARIPPLLRLCR